MDQSPSQCPEGAHPQSGTEKHSKQGGDGRGDILLIILVIYRKISEKYDKPFVVGCQKIDTSTPRANAVIVVLARNKELGGMISSMKSFERHFNRHYNYPYLFFNDGEFNQTFKETIGNYTKSKVEYAKIGSDMWGIPDWTDKEAAKEGIALQGDRAIMYGGMESYHSMCRFYSGYVPQLNWYRHVY